MLNLPFKDDPSLPGTLTQLACGKKVRQTNPTRERGTPPSDSHGIIVGSASLSRVGLVSRATVAGWGGLILIAAELLSGCTEPAGNQDKSEPVASQAEPLELDSLSALPVDSQTATSAEVESNANTVESGVTERLDFMEWPPPKFALFLTGRQHGYIEPCGCTGLANQKGGLARRHSVLEQVRKLGWPTVTLDIGNQVRRFGVQPQVKFQTTIQALRQMKYDVIAFGPDDLRLSTGELIFAMVGDGGNTPFTSANVDVIGVVPTFQIIAAGGHKVGVTTVLGDSHHERVASDELTVTPSVDALRGIWPELESASCDLYVLLAHASIEETQALSRAYPRFDIVVTAGGAGEPTYQPEPIEGSDAVLVQVGTKGMYVGVIGVYDDADQPVRYQRVALDAQWSDSPKMMRLLAEYQQQLEALGLDGLWLRPAAHPSGREFVGSEKCGECHITAHSIWVNTPHSHATQTLVEPPERYEVPRHFDPECLSCHVTGWNPQAYSPYKTGYLELEASRHLHGNGCENCHGPGSEHVAAEEGETNVTDEQLIRLQQQMRLRLEDAQVNCLECHDIDNSPDFHADSAFEKYWNEIEHIGKD